MSWREHQAGQSAAGTTFGSRMEADEGEAYAIFQPMYRDLKLQQMPQVRSRRAAGLRQHT